MPQRVLNLKQVKAMQRKAIQFVLDVLDDPDKADEIEELSPEEYAKRKRIRINPTRTKETKVMPVKGPTKQELQDVIDEVGAKVEEALNPALNREEVILFLQEIDETLNGSDEDEEDEDDEEEEEDEGAAEE